jgi:ferredoxin
MPSLDERQVGDLRVRIDPLLCVSFGDCVDVAPEAFRLEEDGVVAFAEPERVGRERLLSACDACPVDALSVVDAAGNEVVP